MTGIIQRGGMVLAAALFFFSPVHAQVSFNGGGANGGAIRVGTSVTTCDSNFAGGLRYDATNKCLGLCDGTNWACISVAACGDATPAAFNFNDLANQSTSALVASNILQITGISCVVNVAASGEGGPQFRTCGDAACSTVLIDWTVSGTIDNNDYLQLRLTTSAAGGDTYSATVSVGTAADVWNVTPTGDCSGSPAPGTVCPDGTVYAGLSPDGSVKMFVTRCDAGQTWDGTACTGTRSGLTWNNGEDDWVQTGSGSPITGKSNTAMLAVLDSDSDSAGVQDHVAAVYCHNLSQDGYTDWYLPAVNEVAVIYGNKGVIGGFEATGSYYSSTENYDHFADTRRFSDGSAQSVYKNAGFFVRCARR